MGTRTTSESVVRSIILDYQKFEDRAKTADPRELSSSGSIIRSIAKIRQKFAETARMSEFTKFPTSNAKDLATKIVIQKVTFDNACKLLLSTVAESRQDVDNMFDDPYHLIWTDVAADQDLLKKMARFHDLCLASLDQLHKAGCELYRGFQSLIGSEEWQTVGKAFFRRPQVTSAGLRTIESLPKFIKKLGTYNDLFRALARQAVSSRAGFAGILPSTDNIWNPHPSTDDIWNPHLMEDSQSTSRHLNCTHRISQLLFDTFSKAWTCRRSKAHSVSISLSLNYSNTGQKVPAMSFCFSVIVTAPDHDGPYQLLVHPTSWDLCNCTPLEKKCASNTMKAEARMSSFPRVISDKAVNTAEHRGDSALMRQTSMRNSSHDLGQEKDLCRYLKRSCAASESISTIDTSYLGDLQSDNGLKLSVVHIPGTRKPRQTSYSLNDVLARAYSECRVIPVEERLRIASFLATGVLHLHASSWLPHIWSSQDVVFFNADGANEKRALTEPFLQAQLNGNTGHLSQTKKEPGSSWTCLLSLGIILIELAFCKPWHHLQLQDDIMKNLFEWERIFLDLAVLSETVSRELGSKYARVVQTCLQRWLEAQGLEDPSEAELDRCISEDVVKRLDECLAAL